jgi:hypothetical protein
MERDPKKTIQIFDNPPDAKNRKIIVREPKVEEPLYTTVEDTNLDDLSSQAIEVMRREIDYLLQISASKKLEVSESRDLVAYLRLLKEISHQDDQALAKLSDEELEKFLRRKKRVARASSAARVITKEAEKTSGGE